MRQDDPFGLPGGPAGRDHQGIAVGNRPPARKQTASRAIHDGARRQRIEDLLAGRRRQPLVERQHRLARVPRPLQGIDEGWSSRQVDGDQQRHGERRPEPWRKRATDGAPFMVERLAFLPP